MRKIKVFDYEEEIDIDANPWLCIVIENQKYYYLFCNYCFNEFFGDTDYIRLFIDGNLVDNDKFISFIPLIFDLNINTKKNINALYKILKSIYYDKLTSDIELLKSKAKGIIESIAMDFDLELSISNEISCDDLFKVLNLRFLDEDGSLVERFIKYCFVVNELQKINLFIVMNLHSYFSKDELVLLKHELNNRNIALIDIEYASPQSNSEGEKRLIIDDSLCLLS